MIPRTRATLIAAALVLGVTAGPLAAPAFAEPHSTVRTVGGPDTDALREAIAGLPHADATAALVRVGGKDGSWRGSAGVADLTTGSRAIKDARFRAGSTTKVFTAAVVLQLAAEGKVNLNKHVQKYLPGLLPRTFRPVTVRQLLNHTSGIQSADGPGNSFEELYAHRFDTVDPHDQIANAVAKGPEFEPGRKQHYLNINYTLLGVLIEKLTGTSYERAVGDRILKPLGLRGTSFPGTDPKIHGPHNRGYQAVKKADGSTELRDVTEWNSSDRRAAGDIISTTADLERFTVALFRGRIVPKPQLEEMFTVPKVKDVESGKDAVLTAGMTRMVLPDGTEAWGKTGGRYGYNTAMGATRDLSRTLVYSVNATDAKAEGMNPVALKIILAAFSGPAGRTA